MNEPKLCGAPTKDEAGGGPCKRAVVLGATRCSLHGGHTPAARQAASEALARAALPAAEVMFDIINDWKKTKCELCGMPSGDPGPVIRAAQIVLDRTGFAATARVELVKAENPYRDVSDDQAIEEMQTLLAEMIANRDENRKLDAERDHLALTASAIDADVYVVPEPDDDQG